MNLEALAKLATEATPGPWEVDVFEDGLTTVLQASAMTEALCVADLRDGVTDRPEANAAYIAAASPDVVLALVRVAQAARALIGCWDVEHREIAEFVATDDESRLNRRNSWQATQHAEAVLRAALVDLDR